ncbi:hypothetical protein [Pseudarthrobacter sp. NBSH8]|uniref:hypothetical protein n=1 Tax=Pseudarthrobacter sp. NBSH8 TaxID=2596911 RepID=UPI001626B441|nr:hypothetical protein [Pseudarthrobacter sp. NBSH8]QNE13261.1 hypothetical protein FYJ92_01290 [Pseudarthrobacter sp. NBSH8]
MSATIPKVEAVLSYDLYADRITPIGWQAYEIITSILEDPSPDLDQHKWRLRRCVAAHPGAPERALQAHLMATSEVVNGYSQEGPA